MAEERGRLEEDAAKPAPAPTGKAPLPQARRAAPSVNLDAGEWAMQPGRLPPGVEAYRWMLEEFRLALFAPALSVKPALTAGELDALWKRMAGV
jgi:hypothetical protein